MSFLSLTICAALLVQGSCAFANEVTLRVVDGDGRAEVCWLKAFWSITESRDFVSAFGGWKADLRPGSYGFLLIRGRRPSGAANPYAARFDGQIIVGKEKELFVIVPTWTNVAVEGTPAKTVSPAIEGRVESDKLIVGEPVWIRFSPVYQDKQLDVEVNRAGNFVVWNDLDGVFLLTVVQGPRILGTQAVSIHGRRGQPKDRQPFHLTLHLPAEPMQVMRVEGQGQ